jgi:hypothetical protein
VVAQTRGMACAESRAGTGLHRIGSSPRGLIEKPSRVRSARGHTGTTASARGANTNTRARPAAQAWCGCSIGKLDGEGFVGSSARFDGSARQWGRVMGDRPTAGRALASPRRATALVNGRHRCRFHPGTSAPRREGSSRFRHGPPLGYRARGAVVDGREYPARPGPTADAHDREEESAGWRGDWQGGRSLHGDYRASGEPGAVHSGDDGCDKGSFPAGHRSRAAGAWSSAAQVGVDSGAPRRSLTPILTVLAAGDCARRMRGPCRILGRRRTT